MRSNNEHYETLNAILRFISENYEETPVSRKYIWDNLSTNDHFTDGKKQLLVDKLLEDGLIKPNEKIRGTVTGYYISNPGIDFIKAGGYTNEQKQTGNSTTENESLITGNYNTQIFQNEKGYRIFSYFLKNHCNNEADVCYIFRKLIANDFMYEVKHPIFRKYLVDINSNITVGKIKTLAQVENSNRKKFYAITLDMFA